MTNPARTPIQIKLEFEQVKWNIFFLLQPLTIKCFLTGKMHYIFQFKLMSIYSRSTPSSDRPFLAIFCISILLNVTLCTNGLKWTFSKMDLLCIFDSVLQGYTTSHLCHNWASCHVAPLDSEFWKGCAELYYVLVFCQLICWLINFIFFQNGKMSKDNVSIYFNL